LSSVINNLACNVSALVLLSACTNQKAGTTWKYVSRA
jgi:hypothetical protein